MVATGRVHHDGDMSSIWDVRRSATDHKVGGLCGGVAERWGIDPVLVRVGWVLLALSGGIGLVLYAAGWLMIPIAGQTRTHLDDSFPRAAGWPRELRLVLVAVVGIVTAIVLAPVSPFGFGSALVLAAIWYFGYYQRRSPSGPPAATDKLNQAGDQNSLGGQAGYSQAGFWPTGSDPAGPEQQQYEYFSFAGPSTAFTDSARAWQQRMRDHEQGVPSSDADHAAYLSNPDPVGLYSHPHPSADPHRSSAELTKPSSRSSQLARSLPARRLRLVSLVVLGLTLTGLGVASASGAHLTPTTYLAAALLVAGLTLVAASFVGRARGVLPLAVLLALATMVSAVGGTGNDRAVGGGVGIHQVSYLDSTTLPPAENWDSGRLVVDLGRLELSQDKIFSAHVDRGTLVLTVPRGARVKIDSSVDDGYLRIADHQGNWGSELSSVDAFGGPGLTGPVLTVHASVDQGMLEVRR